MQRFFWVVTAVAVVVVLSLIASQQQGTELGDDDFWTLTARIAAIVFFGAFALMSFRERFSRTLLWALAWIAIALVLGGGYAYRFELRDAADRMLAELIPGRAATRGRTVEIARGNSGSFSVLGQINGAQVALVLDTGATSVVLTQDAAKAAGLPLEVLSYSVSIDTANGRARAAPVTLDRLSVGGIVERAVPALIAQPGQLRTNLLGMTFLNRLQSWEVRGDRLVLRAYP